MESNMRFKKTTLALAAASMLAAGSASAALTSFQTFTGNVGYSADGVGSTSQNGTISAQVMAGSTVLAAYLYTSTWIAGASGAGGTFNGSAVSYTSLGSNSYLSAARADVTSIVKPQKWPAI